MKDFKAQRFDHVVPYSLSSPPPAQLFVYYFGIILGKGILVLLVEIELCFLLVHCRIDTVGVIARVKDMVSTQYQREAARGPAAAWRAT